MNLSRILIIVALVASPSFAASVANFESSDVFQMEPVIVEASRLPSAQEIAAADLAATRDSFNASAIAVDELDLAVEIVRQVTAALNANENRDYRIVPASLKDRRRHAPEARTL